MAMKSFKEAILLLKVDCFEGFLNWCKIDRMVIDDSSNAEPISFFLVDTNEVKKRNFSNMQQVGLSPNGSY